MNIGGVYSSMCGSISSSIGVISVDCGNGSNLDSDGLLVDVGLGGGPQQDLDLSSDVVVVVSNRGISLSAAGAAA